MPRTLGKAISSVVISTVQDMVTSALGAEDSYPVVSGQLPPEHDVDWSSGSKGVSTSLLDEANQLRRWNSTYMIMVPKAAPNPTQAMEPQKGRAPADAESVARRTNAFFGDIDMYS